MNAGRLNVYWFRHASRRMREILSIVRFSKATG